VSKRNSVQRAFDAFGKAHFQEKRSGTWVRKINGVEQTFNLQRSQYSLSYYLNVQFHDPATTGPGCGTTTCKTTIQNVHQ